VLRFGDLTQHWLYVNDDEYILKTTKHFNNKARRSPLKEIYYIGTKTKQQFFSFCSHNLLVYNRVLPLHLMAIPHLLLPMIRLIWPKTSNRIIGVLDGNFNFNQYVIFNKKNIANNSSSQRKIIFLTLTQVWNLTRIVVILTSFL
jgi:hypothetical protein